MNEDNLSDYQRRESASADLGGYYLGQPQTLSREFMTWISGYRDLGAEVLAAIAAQTVRDTFEDEEDF